MAGLGRIDCLWKYLLPEMCLSLSKFLTQSSCLFVPLDTPPTYIIVRFAVPGMKQQLYFVPFHRTKIHRTLSVKPAGRHVHNTTKRTITSAPALITMKPSLPSTSEFLSQTRPQKPKPTPLSILPLSAVLRTYLITSLSSSPYLLGFCITILQRMLNSNSPLLHPAENPLLRFLLKQTFYAQFCAGENRPEVLRTIRSIKDTGFSGVILEYALEVLESKGTPSAEETSKEIETWRKGMLETVSMTSAGDFVGLKWSGLGTEALRLLKGDRPPTQAMREAILEVCDAAREQGVRLLPGAEMENMNRGIDSWTLDLQRRCNVGGRAVMFSTYQAYLRSTPEKLASHLMCAKEEGFVAGVKLVRGAYLATEPRTAIWGSKEETDRVYDGLMEALLKRKWNGMLKMPGFGRQGDPFPEISLVIASHNASSVRKAMEIRNEQARNGEKRIECAYAQLYGMADDVSAELVLASKAEVSEPERAQEF